MRSVLLVLFIALCACNRALTPAVDPPAPPPQPVLPARVCRYLYAASAANPLLAVVFNDYAAMVHMPFISPPLTPTKGPATTVKLYGALFYFARLKPRVAFAIGGILRALQLNTAVQFVLDPSVGVGFGINALCWFAGSRWPSAITLGWALTERAWRLLGAKSPSGVPFPIKLSTFPMRIPTFNSLGSKARRR